MLRKILYKDLLDIFYENASANVYLKITDCWLNSFIGFNNCITIQQNIIDSIRNNQYSIIIEGCPFLSKIEIETKNDDTEYSEVISYKDNNTIIYLHGIFINEDPQLYCEFRSIRYSLYTIYYQYLIKNNINHIFVQYTNWLNNIDFNNQEYPEDMASFSKYLKLGCNIVKENNMFKDNIINENFFFKRHNLINNLYKKWRNNHPKDMSSYY